MIREEGLWPPLQPSSTTKLNGGAEVWVACAVLEQKRMDTTLSVVRLPILLTISEILENRPSPIMFSDGFIVWFFWDILRIHVCVRTPRTQLKYVAAMIL